MEQSTDDDEYKSLCAAVGFIVINWAIMEQGLDGLVSIIFHYHDGMKYAPALPRALKNKLDFLSTCFKKSDSLQEYKDEALEILKDIKPMGNRRHDLVHGAITSVIPKGGVFDFAKLDYGPQVHKIRKVQLDLKLFQALASELLDLGDRVADLGHRLVVKPRYSRKLP